MPTQTTRASLIRLLAVALIGQAKDRARQRLTETDEINEEIDLSVYPVATVAQELEPRGD